MKIQVIKFPETPDATLAKVNEFRHLIEAYFSEVGAGPAEKLPSEMLVIMWHSRMADFIELLNDDNERVGLLMTNLYDNEVSGKRSGNILVAYVDPKYRGQGWFKKMLSHAKIIYQARDVDYLEITVRNSDRPFTLGVETSRVYRMDL